MDRDRQSTMASLSSSIAMATISMARPGPLYNGGAAWDNSVSLMIDADKGHDTYAYDLSTGLGRADSAGWGSSSMRKGQITTRP